MNGGRWLLIGQPVAERARVPGGGRPSRIENGHRAARRAPRLPPAAVLSSAAAGGRQGNTEIHKPGEDGSGGMVTDGRASWQLAQLRHLGLVQI